MLCLIEADPLILENKLKICFSLQILTRVAQLKETELLFGIKFKARHFFLPLFNTSASGPSITAKLHFPEPEAQHSQR